MKTPTHPRFTPGQHCGNRQDWSTGPAICLKPIVGHGKKCGFVWAVGVEGLGERGDCGKEMV